MADVLEKGTLFQPELVSDLIVKVKGESALAQLSQREPIPFNGSKEFIFTMDSEVDVVAESGKKSHGGVTLTPKTIVPIKVEYGARISDEFIFASEEEQIKTLEAFNEGFARKVARGIDIMALHGYNPRTGVASTVIGDNHFDAVVTPVETTLAGINDAVEEAVEAVGTLSGMAMSPVMRSALAKLRAGDVAMYPELAWGGAPQTINGLRSVVNETVAPKLAYLGDFANSFKWGFAKEIPLHVIEYGDPDGSGNDLKNYNQVYLRAEVYIGWGILDNDAFTAIALEV